MKKIEHILGGVRFRGVVRERRRELVAQIDQELGPDIEDPVIRNFVEEYLGDQSLYFWYCPDPPVDRWCREPWENHYDKVSGQWTVQTMFVNNHQAWKNFEKIILPYLMESIEKLEIWEEDEQFSQNCTLKQLKFGKTITVGTLDDEGTLIPIRKTDIRTETRFFEKGEKNAEEL